MKELRIFGICICVLLGTVMGIAASKLPSSVTMSKVQLENKIKGGWAGQTIGVSFGSYTEFRYQGTFIQDYQTIPWGEGYVQRLMDSWPDLYDDIYMDLTFVDVLEKKGLDASVKDFAVAFATADYNLWHANQAARYNIAHGVDNPGHWLNNPHADDIDYQIEADFAGLMNPGMPNSASQISDKVGHLMCYGDGWYGGVYVAAMYSLAYVSDDVEYVVTEALRSIPRESRFHACMADVINWHKQYPEDWKKCWEEIEKKWGSNDIACPDGVEMPFNIETYVNGAYIILGLLYGQGDFEKTIDISTRAGQDSDCNPASSGGILGTMIGYNRIPEKFRKELTVVEDIPFNNTVSFNKGCELSFGHALQMIEKNGGKVGSDEVTICFQELEPAQLEISFEGLKVDKKVVVENWIANFPTFEFEGVGAVIKGELKGENVPEDYVAELEVYFNDRLIEVCKLPLKYNHRKHELFFNYVQSYGKYTVTCKWVNPVEGADIWVRDVISYTTDK